MDQQELSINDLAAELLKRRKARKDFASYVEFVSHMAPAIHSRFLCKYLDMAIERKIKRLMVFMPPGHAKSFFISRHFGAYYLSLFPDHSIIAASHTDDFANTWGRRVRNVLSSKEHQILFPNISLSEDSRAAGRWETNFGGEYNAAGVGGNITGRRANLAIIDDPISGIIDAESKAVRDEQWSWYGADFFSRLKKDAIIIIVQTRWHLDDLSGRLLAAQEAGGEKWTVIRLPAIATKNDQLGRKEGEALWPEEYPIERLLTIKQQPAMTSRMWESLYQQSPVLESGNVIKRSWIKVWAYKEPPKCEYIIQSWDTAITAKDKSAYSVCLTFGIFKEEKTDLWSIVILSRWRERVEYPELRKMAQRLAINYLDDNREVPIIASKVKRPADMILIEAKATGEPLIADLNRAGISVTRFNPQKFGDKDARLMLVTDIFENGRFYVPGQANSNDPNAPITVPKRWAQDYINSLIAFPAAESRDDADATSQAIIKMKTSYLVRNSFDIEEEKPFRVGSQKRGPMYG